MQHTSAHNQRRIRAMDILIIKNCVEGEFAEVDEEVNYNST